MSKEKNRSNHVNWDDASGEMHLEGCWYRLQMGSSMGGVHLKCSCAVPDICRDHLS